MSKDYQTLASRFPTHESIVKLHDDDLQHALVQHEAEITKLAGKIDASDDSVHRGRCSRARDTLLRNKKWIRRELQARIEAAAARAKSEEARIIAERIKYRAAITAKNIAEAHSKNEREILIFKGVAREVLGDEMYTYIWELAQKRIEEQA